MLSTNYVLSKKNIIWTNELTKKTDVDAIIKLYKYWL